MTSILSNKRLSASRRRRPPRLAATAAAILVVTSSSWGTQSFSLPQQQQQRMAFVTTTDNYHHNMARNRIPLLTSQIRPPTAVWSSPPPGGNASDDLEWKAIFRSFQLYKAAFGNLKVPHSFVVPNIKPWPKPAHNLKLGKVVQDMRATGKYLNEDRRQALDDLGFVWSVRVRASLPPWQQVLAAVQAYQQIIGSSSSNQHQDFSTMINDMDPTFTVPNTDPWPTAVRRMPLGKFWPIVRDQVLPNNPQAKTAFAKLNRPPAEQPQVLEEQPQQEEEVEVLEEEQVLEQEEKEEADVQATETPTPKPAAARRPQPFEDDNEVNLSVNELRFRNVYYALEAYLEKYGDLLVPQPYIVPRDAPDFPEETWGLRLGARVNAIRSQGTFVNNNPGRQKLLDDLGFVWSPPTGGNRRRTRRAKEEIEGEENPDADMSLLLGESFDFSSDGTFGDSGAGTGETSPSWNLDGAKLPEVTAPPDPIDELLDTRTFEDSLREATERALECGVIEGVTENRRVRKGQQPKNIPWFNDDFGQDFVFDDVVEALTVYKNIHGNLDEVYTYTPGDGIDAEGDEIEGTGFVVPRVKEATGFLGGDRLDLDARAASALINFEDDDDDDDGVLNLFGDDNDADMNLMMAADTSVITAPTGANEWPEHLGGMELGNIVRRIRDGSLEVKHLPERKAQLDALGFDWGDEMAFIDVPFEKAMCAMYAYYMIRGDMFVYEDFVMPDEDPWPDALAGFELGVAVRRIRQLQYFLEAYHPEKVSLLRMIDFVWFEDTMALPLDPNEPEMTPETLLLSAFGHPDYAKMIDIPMGLPDKMQAEGPFQETNNDPKQWWRAYHNWEYVKDYWYQEGRRDNAFYLRSMGYHQMADEHEARYGPGLMSQINATLQELDDPAMEFRSAEQKQELLSTLSYYRQEMLGSTDLHPMEVDELLLKFDSYMLEIMKDPEVTVPTAEDEEDEYEYEEYEEEGEDEEEYEEEGEAEEDYVEEEFEFNVEDELGLEAKQQQS